MRSIFLSLSISFILLLIAGKNCSAQHDLSQPFSLDTLRQKGYTLVFINNDSAFNKQVQQQMIAVFFKVYPEEAAAYNLKSLKQVVMIIDPTYDGVAATGDGIVRINPKWMRKHPEDLDVLTHEVMHIVQSYPDEAGPGWITEGIADYVRFILGVNNKASGWALPEFKEQQSYENAYRVTARFLVWIEKYQSKGLVKKLDNAMRTKTYTNDFWIKTTGKTVEELWQKYAANPVI